MSSSYDLYSIAGESIVVLRKRHLPICDGNFCAAMILDQFYATAELATERSYQGTNHFDPCDYKTYSQMTEDLFELFDAEVVEEAFMLLIEKGYIRAWYTGEVGSQEETHFKIYCDREKVREACKPYYDAIQASQEAQWNAAIERERAEATKRPPPPTPEEIAQREHEQKIARETTKVNHHLKRAQKLGLSATLTLQEWLATLEYFEWKCAYCRSGDYTLLEHFIPLSMDGGTTQGNCVPSCNGCNGVKKSWHPYQIPLLHTKQAKRFLQGLQAVHEYLISCGCEEVMP